MYSVAGRSTVVGTSVRGGVALYAIASLRPKIREIGVFNTTTTAFVATIARFTTNTTPSTGLNEMPWENDGRAASATGFEGHTVDQTVTAGYIRQASIGAAIGAGVIWTFGGPGLIIADGTGNGIGVICGSGTGQIFDYYIDWEE